MAAIITESTKRHRQFGRDTKVEEITGISKATWRYYRLMEIGPPVYRVGRSVLYDLDEVVEWVKSR